MAEPSDIVTDINRIRRLDTASVWRNYERAYRAMLVEERASNYFAAARFAHAAHYSETIYFARVERELQALTAGTAPPSA